ncbi:hypothetical protein [Sphingomonas sp. DC1600-2]|uniref:hypothetical protein n=1 Tax=unclassified Sphingomonas TaxID=196159 RepID=UPI003CF658BA
MTNLFLIASSAVLSVTASPLVARDAKPVAAESQPVGSTQRAPSENTARKYCVVDTVTGSRLSHKVCKTRQDWISQDGFDPLAKQ